MGEQVGCPSVGRIGKRLFHRAAQAARRDGAWHGDKRDGAPSKGNFLLMHQQ
jgi:hypothetical protein